MEFKEYQSLKRFGTTDVEGIELGETVVFPKIDGTNGSVWMGDDGELKAGSRRRELSLDNDNAGFYAYIIQDYRVRDLLTENPKLRLFGEFLVPHSLKTYKDNAWRRFYIFDVAIDSEDGGNIYLRYDEYKPILDLYGVDYVPPICTAKNATYEQFIHQLQNNVFLIEDGKGVGEGIVIKNYEYVNKYGRTTFAKIVTSEFKEKHAKAMGGHEVTGSKMVEEAIAEEYVTKALCEKVKAKIELEEGGWNTKSIPRLLNTVFYDLITEDTYNFLKKHKMPRVDFKTLQHFTNNKIKSHLSDVF